MATVTWWVDASTGNDTTGTGSSSAPWATIEKATDEFNLASNNGDDYVINVVAGGTYTILTSENFIDNKSTLTFTLQGVTALGDATPAMVDLTLNPGTPTATKYLVLARDVAGVTVKGFRMTVPSGTVNNRFVGFDELTTDSIEIDSCAIISTGHFGGSTLFARVVYNSGNSQDQRITIKNCYVENSKFAFFAVDTQTTVENCVVIIDADSDTLGNLTVGYVFDMGGDSANYTDNLIGNTYYARRRGDPGQSGKPDKFADWNTFTGAGDVINIYNNVIYWTWTDTANATGLQPVFAGAVSAASTTDTADNVFYFNVDPTTAYTTLPDYATDLGPTGTDTVKEDTAADPDNLFADITSTYDWTTSSGYTHTILYDLRLIAETSAGRSGALPGALPAFANDYIVTITSSGVTPDPGETYNITVTIENNGGIDATGVSVTVNLDANYIVNSNTPSAGSWSSPTWTVGSLASGASESIVFNVSIPDASADPPSTFTSTATLAASDPPAEAPLDDDTDTLVETVTPDNGTGDPDYNVACIDAIYDFRVLSDESTHKIILICANNNLWYDLGLRVLESSYYAFKTPAQYSFVPFNNFAYIVSSNASQSMVKFNGIDYSVKSVNGAPNIGFAVEHYSRLVGAGDPSTGSFIYASATEDFDDWEPGALASSPIQLGITIDDGQRVTGLSSAHYGRLYVFKERSISVITGSWSDATDVARRTLSTTRGSVNHAVIQQVGNDIFFWDEQGCHSLLTTEKFGDVETVSTTTKIREDFKSLVDFSALDRAHSINYLPEDLYITWFQSRGSDELDIAFVYNYSTREWTIWDYPARCSAIVSPIEDPRYKMWTGRCEGKVEQWPGDQAYSNADMWSGGLLFEDPVTLKNYEEVELYVVPSGDFDANVEIEFNADDLQALANQSTTFNMKPNTGDVLGDFTLDESTLSADDEIRVVKIDDFSGGSGRSAIVKISSSTSGENLEVLGYVVRATRKAN